MDEAAEEGVRGIVGGSYPERAERAEVRFAAERLGAANLRDILIKTLA